jgi:deoxyribonuclease IV
MEPRVCFGVAGNPPNFWDSPFRRERALSPLWLRSIGLDALEIQCTFGVRMPAGRAQLFRRHAGEEGIRLSIHAPYYINLGSPDAAKIENSLRELGKACRLAQETGARRVVFHPGSAGTDRPAALERAIAALARFERENDLGEVHLYPEIGGKVGQLGSLEDIIAISAAVRCAWPCLDLAHLHARSHGSLRAEADFAAVLDQVGAGLGKKALDHLHFHLYPVRWRSSGEVTHRAFHDRVEDGEPASRAGVEGGEEYYLPRYEPFLRVMAARRLPATVICEAHNSQDVGALEMKAFYASLLRAGPQPPSRCS